MKTLLTLCFVCACTLLFAQDTIVRIDSARIVAKVLTIDNKTITYQRHNAPDGPTYVIFRHDVARITYADGFTEKFGKRSQLEPVKMKKNSASVTITDAVSGMLTVNYERIFWNDLGVRLSASRGMLASQETNTHGNGGYFYSGNYYYSRFKPMSLTLDVHYYAHKSSNISYYVGAAMEYGKSKRSDWGGWYPYPSGNRVVEYYMAGLTNGVALRPNGPISLDLYTTLGFMREYRWDNLQATARFGFNVGYRF